MTTPLLLHAGSTLAMTGVIWFVQIVHYPLFHYAARDDFPGFSASYQSRTTWVAMPLMLVEAITAVVIAVNASDDSAPLAIPGLVLVVVIWLSTAFVQAPLHRRLIRGFDDRLARRLVASNWIRTAAWSARSVVALGLLSA